jgi:acetyltransferase-like isoleucine patch superfamily enzyme
MLTKFLWDHRVKYPLSSGQCFRQWAKRMWTLPSLLAFALRSASLCRRGAEIGNGACLSPMQVNGSLRYLRVGENSFIGSIKIHLHAEVVIGSNVCINDGVQILTASHDVRDSGWRQFAKPIRVGDYAWIATGAILLPGVTIGSGSVVGAGAVVARDVPDHAVATGSPAAIREKIRCEDLQYNPTAFLAFQAAWLGRPTS